VTSFDLRAPQVARGLAHLHFVGLPHGNLTSSSVHLHSSTCDSRGFCAAVADYGACVGMMTDRQTDRKVIDKNCTVMTMRTH
jgi:hypothetical protein